MKHMLPNIRYCCIDDHSLRMLLYIVLIITPYDLLHTDRASLLKRLPFHDQKISTLRKDTYKNQFYTIRIQCMFPQNLHNLYSSKHRNHKRE